MPLQPGGRAALREITQEIVLAALGRTDFFRKALFGGGTCLRVFHGSERFSEDLDFSLQKPDASFVLKPYLDAMGKELTAYGYRAGDRRPNPGSIKPFGWPSSRTIRSARFSGWTFARRRGLRENSA